MLADVVPILQSSDGRGFASKNYRRHRYATVVPVVTVSGPQDGGDFTRERDDGGVGNARAIRTVTGRRPRFLPRVAYQSPSDRPSRPDAFRVEFPKRFRGTRQ